jgi:ABC-type phosphate transport system substrate-binding protein
MRKLSWRFSFLGVLVLLASIMGRNMPVAADDEVAVIVNPSNTVAGLSLADIHKIFLGEKSTWPNGKHIYLIMAAPGSAERAVILKNVYKMSENDYAKYFLQASFTGAISAPPKDAASSAQVKQLVAENPGAIGYVNQQDVGDSVKVILKVP